MLSSGKVLYRVGRGVKSLHQKTSPAPLYTHDEEDDHRIKEIVGVTGHMGMSDHMT